MRRPCHAPDRLEASSHFLRYCCNSPLSIFRFALCCCKKKVVDAVVARHPCYLSSTIEACMCFCGNDWIFFCPRAWSAWLFAVATKNVVAAVFASKHRS